MKMMMMMIKLLDRNCLALNLSPNTLFQYVDFQNFSSGVFSEFKKQNLLGVFFLEVSLSIKINISNVWRKCGCF